MNHLVLGHFFFWFLELIMRKFLCLVAVIATCQVGHAGLTYKFGDAANSLGEKGYADGSIISDGNLATKVKIGAWNVASSISPLGVLPGFGADGNGFDHDNGFRPDGTTPSGGPYAYLDGSSNNKLGGLGVTQAMDANNQATPSSDDNVSGASSAMGVVGSVREVVGVQFLQTTGTFTNLAAFGLRDADHNIVADGAKIDVTTDGGTSWTTKVVAAGAITLGNLAITSSSLVAFAYNDTQFYVTNVELSGGSGMVEVPEPATLACLLPIAGLAIARRRRNKK